MTGVEMIAQERERQITEEGYTPTHDRIHGDGSLARAAAVYAIPPELRNEVDSFLWPGWEFKPADRVRELVKAGALIAAEIDRLSSVRPR